MLLLALILLAALWELYKLVIPDDGVRLGDTLILPRSDDTSMPHLSQIFSAFGKQEVAGPSGTVGVVGGVGGVVLAALGRGGLRRSASPSASCSRWRCSGSRIVERALLPYVVLSQTVPLIALAPLVYGWSGNLTVFGARLAAVDVGLGHLGLPGVLPGRHRRAARAAVAAAGADRADALLRRLVVADARAAAAARVACPTCCRRCKLAAAAAVVGAIVAEISTGLRGGIGRLIITYAQQATGDPAKVYAPIFGAARHGPRRRRLVVAARRRRCAATSRGRTV